MWTVGVALHSRMVGWGIAGVLSLNAARYLIRRRSDLQPAEAAGGLFSKRRGFLDRDCNGKRSRLGRLADKAGRRRPEGRTFD